MFNVVTSSISGAYQELVGLVFSKGVEVKDERGSETLECLNVVTTIQSPIPYSPIPVPVYELVKPDFPTFWEGERLERYCKELIDKNRNGFIYTYGNRLRAWFDRIDQIQVSIDRLNNCSESRRAISVTWSPVDDTVKEEVPCLMLVDFKIRDNQLLTTALWRSHEIYGAWYPNIVGLTYLAQYVAKKTNTTVEEITVHSISAHIYSTDLEEAKKVIK